MHARAWALLPVLWQYGEGTRKLETTEGRPIVYVATSMGGGKKGVAAFRMRKQATTTTPTGTSKVALRTIRLGSRGEDVRVLQTRLGIGVDGIFGAGTDRAVRAYQASHGLDVDGIVGRQTWASLMGTSAA